MELCPISLLTLPSHYGKSVVFPCVQLRVVALATTRAIHIFNVELLYRTCAARALCHEKGKTRGGGTTPSGQTRAEKNHAFFPRHDRPHGLEREAFQTENALTDEAWRAPAAGTPAPLPGSIRQDPSCAFSSLPHRRRRGCARFRPLREAPCSSALPQLSCAAHKKSGDSDVSPLSKTACRTARYGVAFMSCTMELSVLVSWARSLTA